MQAITTKYVGATNTRGSRIVASADAGRVTVSWDYALDVFENHKKAAEAYCKKKGWTGRLIGGGVKSGYVWVFASGAERDRSRSRAPATRRKASRSRTRSRSRRR